MFKDLRNPQPAVTNTDLGRELRQAPADDFAALTGPARSRLFPKPAQEGGEVESTPLIGGRRFSSAPEDVTLDRGTGSVMPRFPKYSPGDVEDRQTARVLGPGGAALVALAS